MTATISVSKSAIFELIMAGIEAYAVKHQGSRGISVETAAHLWGYVNKTHPFKCTIHHVSVETSAKRKRSSVEFNSQSLLIKKDIAKVFGDEYQYIGTAHSHPYLREESVNAAMIRKNKWYELSDADHECELGCPEIEVAGKSYSVALVLTIHSMLKADDRKDGTYFGEPLVEFSLGNIKCWLYGRVFEHKPKLSLSDEERQSFGRYKLTLDGTPNDKKVPVPLETVLESSVFIDTLCKDFGRLTFLENESEYDIAAVAERRWS
ncbi:hypothetical protein ACJPQX_19320 [Vibrio vulnificus]|uniref:JAB domain-containing protein n=1 Tax=Vibrio parahaemolyticus TaxID=670 RepID=A0A7Z2RPB2_VIBPH|nr:MULTISPECIES: hypothetical protein [Vibrio]MBH9739328.1 hypothetical protein [Vibrio navarrensis]QHH09639.1 hypothetical protein EHC69_09755 [Vibrio parahaemolyticus]UJX07187.1 hypothetical protein JHT19_09010 [Vibrio parahaemolyticus]HAS6674356.1 hypothetical protein [Vibrio parahaemolyticus]HAS6680049.1 hypothetical protein [Vibrio parahaemolyticus]